MPVRWLPQAMPEQDLRAMWPAAHGLARWCAISDEPGYLPNPDREVDVFLIRAQAGELSPLDRFRLGRPRKTRLLSGAPGSPGSSADRSGSDPSDRV
jgi:hypothetical protein